MIYRFTLQHTSGDELLLLDPKGWDNVIFKLERSERFHGMFFDYAISLQFFNKGGGREYIESKFASFGIDADIKIKIEINCDGIFEDFGTFKLNLENLSTEGRFLTVNLEPDDITQTLLNRSDLKTNLNRLTTLDGTALAPFTNGPYDLTLHGKIIRNVSKFLEENYTDGITIYNDTTCDACGVPILRTVYNVSLPYLAAGDGAASSVFVQPRIKRIFGEVNDTNTMGGKIFDQFQSDNWNDRLSNFIEIDDFGLVYPVNVKVDYHFEGTFYFKNHAQVSGSFDINQQWQKIAPQLLISQIGDGNLVAGTLLGSLSTFKLIPTDADPYSETYNFSGTTNFTMVDGEALRIFWYFQNLFNRGTYTGTDPDINQTPPTFFQQFWFEAVKQEITVTIDNKSVESTCKAFALHEAFTRNTQIITNQTDSFRSSLIGRKNSEPVTYPANGCASFAALTNGYQIRQLGLTTYPVNVSLNELYEGLNAVYNVGMGIEDLGTHSVVRLEKKEFFYSSVVSVQLDYVKDIRKKVAKDYYYNEVNVGYDKWEAEQVQGLDEFNIEHQYETGINIIKNTLNAVSNFVTSGYAIETTKRRIGLSQDWKFDKDKFLIMLNRSEDGGGNPDQLDIAEKDENFSAVNNLLSPETSYNLRISPKRNLLRWMYVIASGLLAYPARLIQFIDGEANIQMDSTQDAGCSGSYSGANIAEGDDIAFDDGNIQDKSALWIPEEYSFSHPLTFTQFKAIKANPEQAIEFSDTDADHLKGSVLKLDFNPKTFITKFVLIRLN